MVTERAMVSAPDGAADQGGDGSVTQNNLFDGPKLDPGVTLVGYACASHANEEAEQKMSELPDFTLPVIHTKACLQAILAAVENPDFDCEETLEKVRVAANEGVVRLNSILDAIAEAGDRNVGSG
jgi:hypothetical protein